MTIDTPEWVRDAVFYQVFPDRFASSAAGPEAGHARGVGRAADQPRVQGRRPPGHRGAARRTSRTSASRRSTSPRSSSRPPTTATTPTTTWRSTRSSGGDDALRELLDAAHARGMRVVLDGVFNHTGRGFWPFHHVLENGAGSPYRDWFHFSEAALEGQRPFRPYPWPSDPLDARASRSSASRKTSAATSPSGTWGTGPGGGCRPCPSSTPTTPRSATTSWRWPSTGCASGSTAGASTCPTEIRDEAFWQEFRRRCRAVEPRGLHRRRDLVRVPGVADRRSFRRGHELPAGGGDRGLHGPGHLDEGVVRRHHEYGRTVLRRDGAAFGAELERLMAALRPRRDGGAAQPPRQP